MTLCDSGDSTILRTDFRQIMSCCRCNRSGMCVGCKCTKSNKPCTSYLPLRLGNCKHPVIPEAFPEASDQSAQVQQHQGSVPDSGQTAEIFIANSMPLESQSRVAVEDESESSGRFPESEAPNFVWGADVSGEEFCARVNDAYEEVIKWRRNSFLLPFGKVSKMFVQEVADLLQAFAQKTSQECIAIKACLLMQTLLLQKPFARSKAKDHASHLQRHLASWKEGDISPLPTGRGEMYSSPPPQVFSPY